MKEIREELKGKLRENFIFSDETTTWELIKKCYYRLEEGYLRQGKKSSIKYINDFCIKFYEKYRQIKLKKNT